MTDTLVAKDYMDIEIFPCAGGMGEGFRRAGIVFDLMIEIEENHCSSYEANLGHRPTQMDARSFLELLEMGWRPPKPVRLLVADPPCTPWSRAGKRLGQNDPRDMLDGTCRIISILKPQAYLIGNVPGLDDGPNLDIVQSTIGELSRHGYCSADFARLDAANYGVPQHRIRPFWFGHLRGPCIQWPAPTHCDPDKCSNLTLPGVDVLLPWVSCAQALGHLSPEELGRPIKLRHRAQNGKQHGTAPEEPARVVGTSNLSDGNVLLPVDAPRSKKRKRDEGRIPQCDRVNTLDQPSAVVTAKGGRARTGASSTLALESAITVRPGDHAMSRPNKAARTLTRNTHSDGAVIVFKDLPLFFDLARGNEVAGDLEAAARDNAEINDQPAFVGSVDDLVVSLNEATDADLNAALALVTEQEEMFPPSTMHRPERTVRAMGREAYLELEHDGVAQAAYTMTEDEREYITVNDKHRPVRANEPAGTVRGGGEGHSAPQVVIENPRHPNARADAPAPTLGAKQRGQGAQVVVVSPNHPASASGAPSNTMKATSGGGSNRALEWPWPRPSTTVQRDERLAPPGHHDENWEGGLMSMPDAVVISERAAAILQGFPETWIFVGDSKKARWSQIGQAMPPPLAHAVAASVAAQMKKADDDPDSSDSFIGYRITNL